MSLTYNQAFGGTGSASAATGWSMPVFSSKTITFTQPGIVVLSFLGAGGGGMFSATVGSIAGPNSAPWGRKKIDVSSGDALTLNIGAGGAAGTVSTTPGMPGSTSTAVLNGATIMTIGGGEPGTREALPLTANPSPASAVVTGADFWIPGVQAGSAQTSGGLAVTGGAAPDLLQTGLGRSPSITGATASTAGLGGSIGTNAGGAPTPWLVLAEWGLMTTDGTVAAAPGRGGSPSVTPGFFGGGAGAFSGTDPQKGGLGAGGGSGNAVGSCFPGGNAYAYVVFTPLT